MGISRDFRKMKTMTLPQIKHIAGTLQQSALTYKSPLEYWSTYFKKDLLPFAYFAAIRLGTNALLKIKHIAGTLLDPCPFGNRKYFYLTLA